MRRIFGLAAVTAALWLVPAPQARAQYGFGYSPPVYGAYGTPYGYGRPYGGYGGINRFQSGYGYGVPYGGYSSGYGYPQGPGVAVSSYYSSGYSSYVAPGAVAFSTGYAAPTPYGYGYGVPSYGYGYGVPAFGGGGYGLATGYPYRPYGASVSTGPFMGLPRPNAGLYRTW